jgi:lauroyl/myristoyl acyltransferase
MSAPHRFVAGDFADASALEPRTRATWTSHFFNTGFAFRAIYGLVSRMPGSVSHFGGWAGTGVAHRLMGRTTAALEHNFHGAFPALSPGDLNALALRTYRSYAADVVDFFRAVPLTPEQSYHLFEDVEPNGVRFGQALALGKGVILVTGHFGNWEIGGALLRALRLPMTIVAMREASDEINRLRVEFRQRFGADTIEVRQSIDTALQIRRRLAENRVVAMLMDRHVDRDRVAVRFFGRRAYFLRTPALLAYMTGAPLLPCSVVRGPSGRFVVRAGAPILVPRELDREVAVQQAAQQFADHLEACIRETPQAWYQFYPYWASQDAVEA